LDWFDFCLDCLINDLSKYKLGINMFYEGAKYVKRCIKYYHKEKLPQVEEYEIEYQDYNVINGELKKYGLFPTTSRSLYLYIDRYLKYLIDIENNSNPDGIQLNPPCDIMMEKFRKCDEKECCYLSAQMMRYLCSNLYCYNEENRIRINRYVDESSNELIIDLKLDYYEDLYYAALYELFLTYGGKYKKS